MEKKSGKGKNEENRKRSKEDRKAKREVAKVAGKRSLRR